MFKQIYLIVLTIFTLSITVCSGPQKVLKDQSGNAINNNQQSTTKNNKQQTSIEKSVTSEHFTIKKFKTFQFTFKKGKLIPGNNIINLPGKDYNLIKDPTPNSNRYYFITDRKLVKNNKKQIFDVKKIRTGLLEIITFESKFNTKTKNLIFINPQYVNFKPSSRSNKLGFSLFYNTKEKKLEMFYAAKGNIQHASSKDGINFYQDKLLKKLNSKFTDRDPSISSDGKILAFSSARNFRSNIAGLQLFIAFRQNTNSQFEKPIAVTDAINSINELFPSIIQNRSGTFVLFNTLSKQEKRKIGLHYSIQIVNNVIYPMVPFSKKSITPFKYISYSPSAPQGYKMTCSYPDNGYDIYSIFISNIEQTVISSKIPK